MEDTFADNKKIMVNTFQLPVINSELISDKIDLKQDLFDLFDDTKTKLIYRLNEIFGIGEKANLPE